MVACDVHLSSREGWKRLEGIKAGSFKIVCCWQSNSTTNEPVSPFFGGFSAVSVCPPGRQVCRPSPVVSRAAVRLPVCPPVRQVCPLSPVLSCAAVRSRVHVCQPVVCLMSPVLSRAAALFSFFRDPVSGQLLFLL